MGIEIERDKEVVRDGRGSIVACPLPTQPINSTLPLTPHFIHTCAQLSSKSSGLTAMPLIPRSPLTATPPLLPPTLCPHLCAAVVKVIRVDGDTADPAQPVDGGGLGGSGTDGTRGAGPREQMCGEQVLARGLAKVRGKGRKTGQGIWDKALTLVCATQNDPSHLSAAESPECPPPLSTA